MDLVHPSGLTVFLGMVIFNQIGLTLIEYSHTRKSFNSHLLLKNMLQFALIIIFMWLLGFGFLYGDKKSKYIGETFFGGDGWLVDSEAGKYFFYFCNLACFVLFIINGSIAEKAQYGTYVVLAISLSIFIWPVVIAWVYGGGWLVTEMPNTIIEYGSIVVYTFAGAFSVTGAVITGRRPGRFGLRRAEFRLADPSLYVLGCFLTILGCQGVAFVFSKGDGLTWANIWICGSMSSVTSLKILTLMNTDIDRHYIAINQGFIAGIVFITSTSDNVHPWEAGLYGLLSGAVFSFSFWVFNKIELDDVTYAGPTFLFPGMFGGILPGFSDNTFGVYWGGWDNGQTLATNVVGTWTIFFWAVFWAIAVFGALRLLGYLNLAPALMEKGLEGEAEITWSGFKVKPREEK